MPSLNPADAERFMNVTTAYDANLAAFAVQTIGAATLFAEVVSEDHLAEIAGLQPVLPYNSFTAMAGYLCLARFRTRPIFSTLDLSVSTLPNQAPQISKVLSAILFNKKGPRAVKRFLPVGPADRAIVSKMIDRIAMANERLSSMG